MRLYAINVDPPAWGGGAGGALLAAATAWLDARFAVSILWVVDEQRSARARFYERAGWSLDGATRIESYGGADVEQPPLPARGSSLTLHAGVRRAGQRSGRELVRHHDGCEPPPASPGDRNSPGSVATSRA